MFLASLAHVCWPHFSLRRLAEVGVPAQVWVLAAQFEVRQQRVAAARKILGMACGMCPKAKLFKAYIELELQLGNVDRCGASTCR